MTLEDLTTWPKATINTEQLADLLGVDRDSIDRARHEGTFPISALIVGRKVLWPTLAVRKLIGLGERPR